LSNQQNYKTKKINTLTLTQLAILIAIMVVMNIIPNVGYIKIGVVEITSMMIPVIAGAIALGPISGAILGGVFGLTSFLQCFGVSFFGTTLFQFNAFFTAIMCFIPRILMGWLVGLIYRALNKNQYIAVTLASIAAPVINTVLFISALILMFGNSPFILELRDGRALITFLTWLVGINGVLEIIASFVIGTAVSIALLKFLNRRKPPVN